MDYVGPFPRSEQGHEYILTFLMLATGWIEAFPVITCNAATASSLFYTEIISRFGCPRKLLTDLGSHFINAVFDLLKTRYQFKHVTISSGNSRGNTLLERRHRNINAAILAGLMNNTIRNSDTSKWHNYVPAALFAMRTNKRYGTEYSVAELTLGYQPELPEEFVNFEGQRPRDMRQTMKEADHFITALKYMRNIVQEEDNERRTARNATYNSNFMEELKEGDTVWMHRSRDYDDYLVAGKLDSNWIGPFIIYLKAEGHGQKFKLQDLVTGRRVKHWIHRRHITRCFLDRPPYDEVKYRIPEIMEDWKVRG